jgi:uncharacterized membrane protein
MKNDTDGEARARRSGSRLAVEIGLGALGGALVGAAVSLAGGWPPAPAMLLGAVVGAVLGAVGLASLLELF